AAELEHLFGIVDHLLDVVLGRRIEPAHLRRRRATDQAVGADDALRSLAATTIENQQVVAYFVEVIEVTLDRRHFRRGLGLHLLVENAIAQRLRRLDLGTSLELGIRPIVGLVHHGSGPRHTSLLDPRFPDEVAAFARAVAARYPWVQSYTPVNEPLTTARFSALYGQWYPHRRDGLAFARALLTQCRAVALAMQAIRTVNPAARLVQTEDLGKVYSTPALTYQAEF